MTVPSITLNNQTTIPQLGFGVFQVPPAQTAEVTLKALEVGYRHIDTAQMYGNEEGVGAAITAAGLPREELYITSKLNNGFHRPDDARRAFDETLTKLGLDRIDLFLIHWPLPTQYDGDFVSTWRTLAEFVDDGRAPVGGRLELPAGPPGPDRRGDRRAARPSTRSRCTPTSPTRRPGPPRTATRSPSSRGRRSRRAACSATR